jgi:hypothetical protein
VNYLWDNWNTPQPLAEFVGNNPVSASKNGTPLYTNLSLHLCLVTEPSGLWHHALCDRAQYKSTDELAERLAKIRDLASVQLRLAQDRQEKAANTFCSPVPFLKGVDQFWLDTRNIRTERPT